ncbi:MAG: DUF1934 domain-containing protein [Lachnospiraceae bacterium]|nr:DUF1934 domain-containing protein [Lachnospiraceae bacterium]MBQ5485465.1 DUF1934 domain-containing protein [Lachnospiraceae bacterium]
MSLGISCQVQVTSRQQLDGEESKTKQTLHGQFYCKGSDLYLLYEEGEAEGERIKNRLTIKGRDLVVTRGGAVTSRMEFTPGGSYSFKYQTPYGMFDFRADTKSLAISREKDALEVDVSYDLFSNDQLVSHNEVHWKSVPL